MMGTLSKTHFDARKRGENEERYGYLSEGSEKERG